MKGYRLFRVFGFEVKLNLTWLLLALLITWTLAAGLFPVSYPELAQSIYWWMGVAGAVGILFSIVFHELSHSLVARHYGLQIRGITLFIFGGIAEMQEEPVNPKVEFLMAIAGPLASVVLAIVFYGFERLATAQEWSTAIIGVSHYLAMVNLIVAIFNLVPAFPLDGGRMLRAVVWHWSRSLERATYISSQFGAGFGLALMVLGGLAFIQGNFIAGMWWLLIGAFLRTAANGSYQQMLIQDMFSNKPVRDFMNTEPITVTPDITIQDWLEDYVYKYHFKMFPVIDNSEILGCIVTDSIKKVPRDQWQTTTVGDLIKPCSSENTVTPDTDVASVLAKMMKNDSMSRFMVVENGSLVGMISLKDLKSYIALKMDIESS